MAKAPKTEYDALKDMVKHHVLMVRVLFRLAQPFEVVRESISKGAKKHIFPREGGALLAPVVIDYRKKKHKTGVGLHVSPAGDDPKVTEVVLGADGFDSPSAFNESDTVALGKSTVAVEEMTSRTLGLVSNWEADVLLAMAFMGRKSGALSFEPFLERSLKAGKGIAIKKVELEIESAPRKYTEITLSGLDPADGSKGLATLQTSCRLSEITDKGQRVTPLAAILHKAHGILYATWEVVRDGK